MEYADKRKVVKTKQKNDTVLHKKFNSEWPVQAIDWHYDEKHDANFIIFAYIFLTLVRALTGDVLILKASTLQGELVLISKDNQSYADKFSNLDLVLPYLQTSKALFRTCSFSLGTFKQTP